MNLLRKRISGLSDKNKMTSFVLNDSVRNDLVFVVVDIILGFVAFVMSVVNVITEEYILMIATLTVTAICVLNLILLKSKVSKWFVHFLLYTSLMVILFFFIISGHPDGFSALWLSLVPTLAMMLMGYKKGTLYSFAALTGLIFLFWIPVGKSMLKFEYGDTFMLRYPFFYVAVFLLSLSTEIIRKQTHEALVESNNKYEHLYKHDALTGLYNRYGINEKIKLMDSVKQEYTIMIMDIDNFKKVNDTYGHDAGDEVLKNVADVMRDTICEDSYYARWGGEEFIVFMPCRHDPLELAENIRKNIEKSYVMYENKKICVTISIGVCIKNKYGDNTTTDILNIADACLYESKTSGKNRYTVKKV